MIIRWSKLVTCSREIEMNWKIVSQRWWRWWIEIELSFHSQASPLPQSLVKQFLLDLNTMCLCFYHFCVVVESLTSWNLCFLILCLKFFSQPFSLSVSDIKCVAFIPRAALAWVRAEVADFAVELICTCSEQHTASPPFLKCLRLDLHDSHTLIKTSKERISCDKRIFSLHVVCCERVAKAMRYLHKRNLQRNFNFDRL